MKLGVIDLPEWAARGVIMGWDVAHAGHDPASVLAEARKVLPGLYDRTPPEGTLQIVEIDKVAEEADLVLCAPGRTVQADCPVLTLDPARQADPAWLIPEIVVDGAAPDDLLLALGVAPVSSVTDWGMSDHAALVGVLRALRAAGQGTGQTIARTEALWPRPTPDWSLPVETADRVIPLDWTDYNGHMTEARYLHAFGDATDRLMRMMGCDAAYIEAGHSFFTAETHIRHLGECHAGDRIQIETQAIRVDGPKLHFFHGMWNDGRLVATGEHFMLHVSLTTRRPTPPIPPLDAGMSLFGATELPRPEGAGRAVGQSR